jgi:serine-type D-Ala-D-Ala endopeptidase (penicillin-binding protein 7)
MSHGRFFNTIRRTNRMRIFDARSALALATTMLLSVTATHADTSAPQAGEVVPSVMASDRAQALPQNEGVERFWTLTGKPQVRSSSVVIFDPEDESVVYSKDAKRVMPIASITKLMTALVVRDADQPLDEVIKITLDDRDTLRGTTSRLLVGTQLTRADLLHLALMSSENRAAHAIGRNYPGGLPGLVRTMNAKAKFLGMKTARFVEPTGLSNGNVSSAADLVKLVVAASRDPLIREYSTSQSHIVTVGREILEFKNSNSLVTKDDWQISLQKTGYTSDAGRCLVMTALIQDRPVVMILLNSVGKYTRIADARRVRTWMEVSSDTAQFAGSAKEAAAPALGN